MARDIGIDLGTANTLIYMKGKGIILREPSVVAVDIRNDTVKFVGDEAKEVVGRTPASIVAVRPLKDGVIADFDIAASMLQLFIKKTLGSVTFNRPRVVICIPSGVTAVERRAVREVAFKAGARQVAIVEEPMAAAIGAGLPVAEPTGCMIVDIGGGTAEVAVISMGSIVASRSVRSAGDEFEKEIIAYVKRKYNVLIGDRTAEEIKIAIASAAPYEGEEPYSAALRELREETGGLADKLEYLGAYYGSAGFCDEKLALYFARLDSTGSANPDEDEFLTVERYPLADFEAMIARGEIADGKTLSAYALARAAGRI